MLKFLVSSGYTVMQWHGDIVFLDELDQLPNESTIRVTGKLIYFDAINNLCQISEQQDSLLINTSLIEISRLNEIHTFIGVFRKYSHIGALNLESISPELDTYLNRNIQQTGSVKVLHAAILSTDTQPLDMLLLREVVTKRRLFLARNALNNKVEK